MIVRAATWDHVPWLTSRALFTASPEFKGIEAVDDTGRIHGMAGFDGWTPNSVVVTIALDNPAALRNLLPAIFGYAFVQANRGVLLAVVQGINERSLKLCKHVGLSEVCRIRDGVDLGNDMIIMQMRREDCRWLQQRKVA